MRTNCVRRTSYIVLYCVSNIVRVMKSRRRQQNKYGENHNKVLCTVKIRDGGWFLDYMGIKYKVKFTLEEATKAQRGSRGIASLFR